jgi:hypothetical protein
LLETSQQTRLAKFQPNATKKKKTSKDITQARRLKKQARKEFDEACKNNGNKTATLAKYKEAQSHLKLTIQNESAEKIKTTYNKIVTEGGFKSQTFWKTRRRILGANKPPEYETVDEQGNKILDLQESKEHIASYFEQLYRACEADRNNQSTTEEITEQVKEWEKRKNTTNLNPR